MAARRKINWVSLSAKGCYNFVLKTDARVIQCTYCGKFIPSKKITRDHVYPKSKGGLIRAPACEPCNTFKEDMLPIEYALIAFRSGRDIAIIPIGEEEDDDASFV